MPWWKHLLFLLGFVLMPITWAMVNRKPLRWLWYGDDPREDEKDS